MKRKQLIYGNCKVLSPDGELMFRCVEKRAIWYVDRNLAVVVDNDPLTIRLNFKPNGKGEKYEHLKDIRENKCVVCGEENLENLTKHHLIPHEYRRYFPNELKQYNSIYIVPICQNCHEIYERDFAYQLKQKIDKQYDSSRNTITVERRAAEKYLAALLRYEKTMPIERVKELRQLLVVSLKDVGVNISVDELKSKDTMQNCMDFLTSIDEDMDKRHGKVVVDKCKDLETFSLIWVKHFIDSMKPMFLPQYINDLHIVAKPC